MAGSVESSKKEYKEKQGLFGFIHLHQMTWAQIRGVCVCVWISFTKILQFN